MAKEDKKEQYNLDDPALYINRELSMLEFQWRVLDEAFDKKNPLLERIFFLSIVSSNLDEFFMVRVGGLKMQLDAGVLDFSIDGLTPAEQLAAIRKEALKLMVEVRKCLANELTPALNDAGIHILNYTELSDKQKENIDDYFDEIIFPVLTPLAFDPGHPFPHISNLSLNLAVLIEDEEGVQHFARVKVPASLPRLVPIKRSSGGVRRDGTVPYNHYFVWIEEVVAANLASLFPGMKVVQSHPFRVTRNADMIIQELEASDLLETMEESVRKRRFGNVVRLSVNANMPNRILEILINNLEVDNRDVYILKGALGLSSLMQLYKLIERYDLKYKPFFPATPSLLRFAASPDDGSIFSAIRRQDILLHHPYDSFVPVIDFLKHAARDPNVLAIKQTLYRVGSNSPIVKSLLEARRDYGKQVAALVELKARFDEESNIGWARMLEREGVHVTYGLLGLKTHSKITLVVRKEGEHIRRYVHLGTGNYNHITAQLYEDIGMFTCDEEIGADASDLFNYLTGYSSKNNYCKLLVAPINLRERFEEMIREEIELQKQGEQGHLIFKMNALVDKHMIRLLYEASQVGIKVDLLVRGICCLRPGIEGLSENIRVISIVGRFLEHSRIYYFKHGGSETVYMGSADLMPRNLNQRVEVLFPVNDPRIIRHIRDTILETYLTDNVKSRIMQPDGSYKRVQMKDGEKDLHAQFDLIKRYQLASEL
ncbi:MAG: polyphosphate kinase 1 [Anaerolineales bacterium]|nr:polyphosphate kinase 1 [Anaerolineales bacterium]